MISDINVLDCGYKGSIFTWWNRREGERCVRERLDRALCSIAWKEVFPTTTVLHEEAIGSDHCPIIVNNRWEDRKGSRSFKFENFWASDSRCKDVIEDSWVGQRAQTLREVQDKLSRCSSSLKKWSKMSFSNNLTKIEELKGVLRSIQQDPLGTTERLHDVENEINKLWRNEEIYWQQRSRVQWLQAGDKNTSFFHKSVLQRRSKNKVVRIRNERGQWLENEEEILVSFQDYYRNLFEEEEITNVDQVLGVIKPVIVGDLKHSLDSDIVPEEITRAVFQLGANKAPGPDGYNGFFFQKYWHIVGPDVTAAVLNFFSTGIMPSSLNSTDLVLIPKVLGPEDLSQFRPISLCNFLYKVVSKVLVNRLKSFLPDIMSKEQSAFISGRLIQDNIVVAHEVFHFLKRKKRGKREWCAVKTDMKKAYDRVNWSFLERLLLKMGFSPRWINWIMECVRGVTYRLLLNGKKTRIFKPHRGLRQGDPLSPYLFIFVAESLSLLIKQAVHAKELKVLKMSKRCPSVSHLFFADDAVFFVEATARNIEKLRSIMELYCSASGQAVNLQKSSVLFSSNTTNTTRKMVEESLEILPDARPGKYLGIPVVWGRSKKATLQSLHNRIASKLKGWKQKLLSHAGREVLIKSVISSIPAYFMSCFKLPKSWCEEINAMVARF